MTLQEHIDAIKATINDRMKKMSDIMTKAANDNGSTLKVLMKKPSKVAKLKSKT